MSSRRSTGSPGSTTSGRILYVGHGGTLRAVLAHARGITYVQYRRLHATIANCSLHTVAVRDGRFPGPRRLD